MIEFITSVHLHANYMYVCVANKVTVSQCIPMVKSGWDC